MRIIFFGTPDYVLPVVKALYKKYNQGPEQQLVAVVTQEPKPMGRHNYLAFSPVDDWAHKRGIKVLTDPELVWESDLGIVASYGKILSEDVIKRFKYGILNIHPSCLPDLRGATPIPASILRGDTTTCVSIIKMDEQMDHGPIVSKFKEEIKPGDTTESLRARLFSRSSEVLIELIPSYISGKINLKLQDHKSATFTSLLKRSDGYIPPKFLNYALDGNNANEDWKINFIKDFSIKPTPVSMNRFIAAMHPWPNAWSYVIPGPDQESRRLKIISSHLDSSVVGSQSTVVLKLDEVQLEAKPATTWDQLKLGYPSLSFQK
jgi:methionyl-tRNA formyltransferase